jgi:hypothetical protein
LRAVVRLYQIHTFENDKISESLEKLIMELETFFYMFEKDNILKAGHNHDNWIIILTCVIKTRQVMPKASFIEIKSTISEMQTDYNKISMDILEEMVHDRNS